MSSGGAILPVLVVNDTRVDRHHGCARVMGTIAALLGRNNMRPIAYWPAHRDWRGSPAFDAAMKQARLVLVNGEGTIHHERPAGSRLLEIGAMARTRNVPAALVNTAWDANGTEFAGKLTDFALLSARDSHSAGLMRASGQPVSVVPDLSLYGAARSKARPRHGIGFGDNVDRLRAVELDSVRRACGGETVAITFARPGPAGYLRFLRGGLSLRQDWSSPRRLLALLRLRHRLWQAATPDAEEFLDRLSRLALLVSGRFHACTLALAADTPFVAIASNTHKIASLVADAGLAKWRHLDTVDPRIVVEAAAAGWNAEEQESRKDYLADASRKAERLFADLAKLAA